MLPDLVFAQCNNTMIASVIIQILQPNVIVFNILTGCVCVMGDLILTKFDFKEDALQRAITDEMVHGLVGLLSWAAVINCRLTNYIDILEVLACGIMSSVCIDVDHFLAAKSLKLEDALHLPQRPPFHCSTLIPVIGGVIYILQRTFNIGFCPHLPWMFILSWTSHHIRDASRRGLWFAPFGSTYPIPYWFYVFLIVTIPLLFRVYIRSQPTETIEQV